ncbi:AAA family ATPase [Peribacillus simplex]|uniref:AAA family ATPase n=1 Tax=Peribacillus simplex TaxID=1478 RepID=UPI0011A132E1|nr:AAA family ATPase [Peribacillus simplex]
MKIKQIIINNFRKLKKEVTIDMDNNVLIVGKNNTGKTSVFEIFQKFFKSNVNFKFEDFSNQSISQSQLNEIYQDYNNVLEQDLIETIIRRRFPSITLDIVIQIQEEDNLVDVKELLFEFENNDEIILTCKYEIGNIVKVMNDFNEYNLNFIKDKEKQKLDFCAFFKRKHLEYYDISYYSKKNSSSYIHKVNKIFGEKLLNIGVINAQREVDDTSDHKKQTISNSIWEFYNKVSKKDEGFELEDKFKSSIDEIKGQLNNNYDEIFEELISEINTNALNNNKNQGVKIISEFSIEEVLKKNSKLRYELDDLILPESYNGLGYSNMLSMFIQVLTYKYEINQKRALFNILFIEEPESHLHPQMQSVFLKRVEKILGKDANTYKVITSHSSYILQTAELENIRYFLVENNNIIVRSLNEFFIQPKYQNFEKFIKRYFKINTCDLFFTDKAILVEGTVERILMPILIEKYDATLSKQHITLIEVGGAYAHIFNDLLDFLKIKTLIITDIDSVSGTHNKKCRCDISGEIHLQDLIIKTSNATIKNWFNISGNFFIADIIENFSSKEKLINENYNKKITFQLPINGEKVWGRTFEEQFIIENKENIIPLLKVQEPVSLKSLREAIRLAKNDDDKKSSLNLEAGTISVDLLEKYVFEIVDKIEKTDFALDILTMDSWSVPNYIKEGLKWLKN